MVQKYLGTLGRDSVYRQIRSAACRTPGDGGEDAGGADAAAAASATVMEDAIDLAMMDFGAVGGWGWAGSLGS